MMRRSLVLIAVSLAASGCGGASTDSGSSTTVDRDALITRLLESVHATVGDRGTPCVETYLRARSDAELASLTSDQGGVDDLDRAYTAAVVACVDR